MESQGELLPEMRRITRASPKLIADAALVTLTAVNPHPEFAFPTRHLILEPDQSVPLGRMSKKNTSFTATGKNGWIDSAVMSRSHASLFSINSTRDVGSLHGTFYNDTRLKPHQIQAVKDGDLIRFGIPVDRGSDTCPPCTMQATVQFGPQGYFQAPTVFRVPDDTDEEESADEDQGDSTIRHGLQVLRDNNIRPAKNCIAREAVITIDLSDHEMGSPAPEDQTVSTRSIQDHMTDKAISEKSHSRIPSPPGTIDIPDDISDDDAIFYEDEYEEYMSESDDDSHGQSSLEDPPLDHTLRHDILDSDEHVPHLEATEVHEAEIFDRFENHCLPPIMNFSMPNATSAPNQSLSGVQLPSLFDTFRSQEISTLQNNTTYHHNNETDTPNQSFVSVPAAPEQVEPKFWPEDVAQSRATESSILLDSGAEFLKSPLKEHLEANIRPDEDTCTLGFDESSAYQFEVTKTILQQQRQEHQQVQQQEQIQEQEQVQNQQSQQQQQVELRNAHAGSDHPMESPEKLVHNKRKAMEISEMTTEEIPFAERYQAQNSSPPSARPRSLEDSAMDTSPVDVHSAAEEPQVKRLRKAAEIFGYAALGGVAVMSALIATAPTL
ncbi:hypothetical protein TrVFT333_005621 [Trichoderma virens FT-333]|nr:hypothetical protein TrVFT333_005621 [Trichoderma virens FT-333]